MKLAQRLGDAAFGGQVVISGAALMADAKNLNHSGFLIRHLGVYNFNIRLAGVRVPSSASPGATAPRRPPR